MNIEHKTVLITGANRGIGKALVDEALRRGAKKVYAGMQRPVQHPDNRVTPLTLDVTNGSQIQRAPGAVDTLDVLVNNAGIAIYDDLSSLAVLEQTFALNFFGLLGVTSAFLPLLKRSKGAILNNVSLAGLTEGGAAYPPGSQSRNSRRSPEGRLNERGTHADKSKNDRTDGLSIVVTDGV